MVKHGFVLGWAFAWFLIGFWKYYAEDKVNLWWSVAFFVGGLVLGTIVQTLMDRAEARRNKIDKTDTTIYDIEK